MGVEGPTRSKIREKKCTSFFEIFGFERPLLRYLLKTVLHCKGSGIWLDAITQVERKMKNCDGDGIDENDDVYYGDHVHDDDDDQMTNRITTRMTTTCCKCSASPRPTSCSSPRTAKVLLLFQL